MGIGIQNDEQCAATESGARKLRAAIIDLSLTDAVSTDQRDMLWDMIHDLRDQAEAYRVEHPDLAPPRPGRGFTRVAYLISMALAVLVEFLLPTGPAPLGIAWGFMASVALGFCAYRDDQTERARQSMWPLS